MSIDWSVLLSKNFWLAAQPGTMTQPLAVGLLVIFSICLLAAIVLAIFMARRRALGPTARLWRKVQNLCSTFGIVGFVILFFFWQQVPYLSSRWWLLVWLVGVLIWLGFIGRFGFVDLPARQAELEKQREQAKYLPPHKK